MAAFSEEQALVAEANQAFYRAFESFDLEQMRAVWLESDDVACIHPGWELLTGREVVLRSWELIFRDTPRLAFELSDVMVVADRGIGWVSCVENLRHDGEVVGLAVATNLFRQNADGRWFIVCHHASPYARGLP